MSRSVYSSLDDAFQPLNPQEQKAFHQQRVSQQQQMKDMWQKPIDIQGACNKDMSEIYSRMQQKTELPAYCAKENDVYREFQRKGNEERENYLKNMNNLPRAQLSNDYQDVELGMYRLRNSQEDSQALVKVPNQNRVYLEKRLAELEKELQKYQFLIRVFDEENKLNKVPAIMNEEKEQIESFSNIHYKTSESSKDEIVDLIVLLAIGLLIIFVLDSVFKMGKFQGSKTKSS